MCITSDGKRIFLGGNIDNSVRVYSGDPNGLPLEVRKVHGNVTFWPWRDDQILVIALTIQQFTWLNIRVRKRICQYTRRSAR